MIDPLYQGASSELRYGWQRDVFYRAGLKVITPAAVEPLTLDQAAAHLRLDAYGSPATYPEADLILAFISAAREYAEAQSGLALAPQTLELSGRTFETLTRWPGDKGILLRTAPVTSVEEITYVDGTGARVTLDPANYILDDYASIPAVFPSYSANSWPVARDEPNSVRIRFVAGYDNASGSPTAQAMPSLLLSAIKLVLGHLFDNREETTRGEGGATLLNPIPLGIDALIQRYRIRDSFA